MLSSKLRSLRNKVPIPFDHLFDEKEVRLFVTKVLESGDLSSFILETVEKVDQFLDQKEAIKNFYVYYDFNDQHETNKADLLKYLYYTLGSSFYAARIITSYKLATHLTKELSSRYGKAVYGLDDFTLVSVACDGPTVTPLADIMKQVPSLSLFKLLKFTAAIPSLELDSTSAELAGSKVNGAEKGFKVFTLVTKIIDYSPELVQKINRIERDSYCEFRGKVQLAWIDSFFNPARMSLLGLMTHGIYPLAALVDFSDNNPRPFPEHIKLETSSVRDFIKDSLILTDEQFLHKYYDKKDEATAKVKMIEDFKSLVNLNTPTGFKAWESKPNRVGLVLSGRLRPTQLKRIMKHFAHAKKRLDLIHGKDSIDIPFGVRIAELTDNQKVKIYKENQVKVEQEIKKSTYSSKFVMKLTADTFDLQIDGLSHVPEKSLSEYSPSDPEEEFSDHYLYTDL